MPILEWPIQPSNTETMCTVTYLPLPNNAFLLTHNRDEQLSRGIARLPTKISIEQKIVLAPIDSQAGGTWIATSQNHTLCLLNGGAERHVSRPPYRHSRGNIIFDFFRFPDVSDFIQNYDTKALEPFTLLVLAHQTHQLFQYIFDGLDVNTTELRADQAHIWSSTTLYDEHTRMRRKNLFQAFLNQPKQGQKEVLSFHTNGFEWPDKEDIQIDRNGKLKTVSLTSVHKSESISMNYFDFIRSQKIELVL